MGRIIIRRVETAILRIPQLTVEIPVIISRRMIILAGTRAREKTLEGHPAITLTTTRATVEPPAVIIQRLRVLAETRAETKALETRKKAETEIPGTAVLQAGIR